MIHKIAPVSVFAAWIGLSSFGFWTLEMRYVRPVTGPAPQSAHSSSGSPIDSIAVPREIADQALAHPGQVIVANFWAPDCACTRFNEDHLRRLMAQWGSKAAFVTFIEPSSADSSQTADMQKWTSRHIGGQVVWDDHNRYARNLRVWASPAAVIFDAKLQLRYRGAYNAGRFCSNPKTAWVDQALSEISKGSPVTLSQTVFFGCQSVHS